MPCIRDYWCADCGNAWQVFHDNSDDPIPDCPVCASSGEWQPGGFNMKSNKSRAADLAQTMLHEDFGLDPSQINDNQREGDIAYKAAPPSRAQIDADAQIADVTRQIRNEAEKAGQPVPIGTTPSWGGAAAAVPQNISQIAATARASTEIANREGCNPMLLLNKAQKAGIAPTSARVLSETGERQFPLGKNMFGK